MRSIKRVHESSFNPIADLITYSPLPSPTISHLDPFLFLNHHGPQKYKPNNNGLPFGPHPHRGMETVTFILEGDILHKDNSGHESVINAGGVQWMTAGIGLMHAEVSSPEFKKHGGPLEILQLWLNLPSKFKMVKPFYEGLNKEDIPTVELNNGEVIANVISGTFENISGAFDSKTDVTLCLFYIEDRSSINLSVPQDHNIFFYVVRGEVIVNSKHVKALQLVEFNHDGNDINIAASSQSVIIFGHAMPFNEPIIARGPFVMNSEEEIVQAYRDFRAGKFGVLDI
jgi:redox-sensitive bicupin YhaK (pirin superfamily)